MKKETFRSKGLNKPFNVYVVFEDLGARCGEIREFICEITKHKLFGLFPMKRNYNIRIFDECELKDGHFYWELYNGEYIYKSFFPCNEDGWLDLSHIFLGGDGTDNHYTRGSRKMVFLDKDEAVEQATILNNNAKGDVEQIEMLINIFKNKKQ